jgi:hypothetical protein
MTELKSKKGELNSIISKRGINDVTAWNRVHYCGINKWIASVSTPNLKLSAYPWVAHLDLLN